MHKVRLNQLERQIFDGPILRKDRPPKPFAATPTRVAWQIEADFGTQDIPIPNGLGGLTLQRGTPKIEKLAYIGKPCRYRAIEATNFIQRVSQRGRLMSSWQCEYDRGGLVACLSSMTGQASCDAYFAYHPQGGDVNPILAFAKPVYLKVIGKFPTYSHQKRLSQEQIDQFYQWFEETFDQTKLKRPRKKSQKAAFEPLVDMEVPTCAGTQYAFNALEAEQAAYIRFLDTHPIQREPQP